MPYQFKALLHQLLRCFPKSVHEAVSERIIKHGFRKIDKSLTDLYDTHLESIEKFFPRETLRLLEFGAGRDLLSNLYLAVRGVKKQTTVDIEPHVKPVYLNYLIDQASPELLEGEGETKPPSRFTRRFREELKTMGITYTAPCDLCAAPYADNSFDAVISTSTLEHIPVADIHRIMRELKRILAKGGVASFIIDYRDHYSYSDSRINVYNFLGYSKPGWRFFSTERNYQNRLRHHEYVEIFKKQGFEVLSDTPERSDDWEDLLGAVKIAGCFESMGREALSWQGGYFVLLNK